MVGHQSCAGLVNASALHDIEQEMDNGDSVNVIIAEISAELQREPLKNAELMERISLLEAQIKERDMDSLVTDGNGCCHNATERRFKKFRRLKTEPSSNEIGEGTVSKSIELASQVKHDTQCKPSKESNLKDRLVNWMSMDENQFPLSETFKDGDFGADYEDADDTDDEDDYCYEDDDIDIDQRDGANDERAGNGFKEHPPEEGVSKNMHTPCLDSSACGQRQSEPTSLNVIRETDEDERKDCILANTIPINNKKQLKILDMKENKRNGDSTAQLKLVTSGHEISHKGCGSLAFPTKPSKIAFCPKEVKRIIESEALLLKNAQPHTIRKIIVFASLGIRHGCEDMYGLDFTHFSILMKGELYVSPTNPGEHDLYENPGARRKIFYPNRQNPTLCPVKILEEEKAMRPSDASCPSCLFLCIKYGGRTRNFPQNEYVRQRMGRNKLKSFGPVICRMAMLVYIRSGSFFFKAMGITLLFMAGFPDNLVQRETKYRNLALLQKYYRGDEDAEGEELYLPHPETCDIQASPKLQQLTGKANSRRLKGKKQIKSASKPQSLQKSSIVQSAPPSATPPTQFGLMGYASIHTNSMAAFQSMPSQTLADTPPISNVITDPSPNIAYLNQIPYFSLPPQPTNAFMTMMYYPPPNTHPSCHFPSSYGYRSFPSAGNFTPIQPQPYFSHPSCGFYTPKIVEDSAKNDEADSDSDSNSRSTEPKEAPTSFQQ